jgi:hypothetical protein
VVSLSLGCGAESFVGQLDSQMFVDIRYMMKLLNLPHSTVFFHIIFTCEILYRSGMGYAVR